MPARASSGVLFWREKIWRLTWRPNTPGLLEHPQLILAYGPGMWVWWLSVASTATFMTFAVCSPSGRSAPVSGMIVPIARELAVKPSPGFEFVAQLLGVLPAALSCACAPAVPPAAPADDAAPEPVDP